MTPLQAEWMWLDDRDTVTLSELCRACGMSAAEVDELVEYGALPPVVRDEPEEPIFSARCIPPLRTAGKLRMDFDLDLFTVAVLLGYLDQIDALERQVQALTAQIPPRNLPPLKP